MINAAKYFERVVIILEKNIEGDTNRKEYFQELQKTLDVLAKLYKEMGNAEKNM